ncbi:hypothetical protein Pyn_04964 [Prunus yedoensis var. nudiflora]|uniref:Uncharacterized protein n=1 Tax=Prunus yedoensis var. nudiflora TaxID=2094558 RepID=A0A314Y551_PRUYE|nr:hypothetical protein Pyn_04964 [Prunus yedoensis var. nudiflora]
MNESAKSIQQVNQLLNSPKKPPKSTALIIPTIERFVIKNLHSFIHLQTQDIIYSSWRAGSASVLRWKYFLSLSFPIIQTAARERKFVG